MRLRARSEHPLLAGTVVDASRKRWEHPYAAADGRDGGEELMAGRRWWEWRRGERARRGLISSLVGGKSKFFCAARISRRTNLEAWATHVVLPVDRGILGSRPVRRRTRREE